MGYGDALRDEVRSDSVTPLVGIFDMCSASLRRNTQTPCQWSFATSGLLTWSLCPVGNSVL